MSRTVLFVAENHLPSDGRAIRFAAAMSDAGYKVIGAGYERGLRSPPTTSNKFDKLITIPSPLDNTWHRYLVRGSFAIGTLLRPLAKYSYWLMPQQWPFLKAIEKGLGEENIKPDIIIAKYWTAAPVAQALAKKYGGKFIYDANELSYAEREHSLRWRWMIRPITRRIELEAFRAADFSTTIGQGLSNAFVKEYKLSKPPLVLRNIPDSAPIKPSAPSKRLSFLYSGHSDPSRNLHLLIESVALWKGDRSLAMQLTGRADHIEALHQIAKEKGLSDRVEFRPATSQKELVKSMQNDDVGLCILPLHTRQAILAEPNKLYQYLCAGLPIVTSPGTVFAQIFDKYKCGICRPGATAEQIADTINSLSHEKILAMHPGVIRTQQEFSWHKEKQVLIEALAAV